MTEKTVITLDFTGKLPNNPIVKFEIHGGELAAQTALDTINSYLVRGIGFDESDLEEIIQTETVKELTLSEPEVQALSALLDYAEPDEARHFENCEEDGIDTAGHIYRHIRTLRNAITLTEPAK